MGGVRFAPSPTGRFHLGNLRTAWISHLFAKTLGLPWVVRFEDIDEPRNLAGAADQQLADLAELGFIPDQILTQSHFRARHVELFRLARNLGAIYPCQCSRKEVQTALAGLASASHDGTAPIYSGACRLTPVAYDAKINAAGVAWRFRMPHESGGDDFIIARTSSLKGEDGFIPAYHWACAIDDFDGECDVIVRSSDLASALPLQRALHSWIAKAENKSLPLIRAFHTSLVTQDDGHRLEKRTKGVTLDELRADGWTPAKLLSSFEKSFDQSLLKLEFVTAGEARTELKLSELLASV